MPMWVIQLVIFIASTAYTMQQTRKAKKRAAAAADKRKGFEVTVSGEASPLPIVYGKNLLGGIEVKHNVTQGFASGTDNSTKSFLEGFSNSGRSGSKNEYLHVQYALSTDGIEGVQWVKVDGQHYNDGSQKFKHFIRTFANGGTADTIATANGMPSSNRFTSTAFASATYQLNRDDQNYNGVPQVEFLVKGRKIKSVVRTGSTYTLASTPYYSNNPSLVLLDYLTYNRGRGLASSYIDLKSFYDAALICDTVVATNRTIGGKVNGQKAVHTVANEAARPTNLEDRTYENELWYATAEGTYWQWNRTTWVTANQDTKRPIPLYECNVTLSTQEQIRDNIERIMETMGLAELTWSSEGKYKLNLEHPTTLAETEALVDPAHIFTDDDIIRDEVNVSWPAASDRLSQATISFSNEHEDFKEDTVTFPETNSSVHQSFLTEDNDQPFTATVTAEGTTDPYHALAMAEQAVRKARTIFTVEFTVTKKGINLEPGDFIILNSDTIDIGYKVFRVESIAVNADFTVKLNCYRFDQDVLAWNINDDIAYVNPPVFDFSIDAPTNLTFSNTGEILGTTSGNLSWTIANDSAVHDYLVEIKPSSVSDYTVVGTTRGNNLDMAGMTTGQYDISVRSRSPLGTMSNRLVLSNQSFVLVTVGKVKVIYANGANEATNTQSDSPTGMTHVAYLTYDGDEPPLPIRSGIEFVQYIGPAGVAGNDGTDGTNGTDGNDGNDGIAGTDAPRFAQVTLYTNPAVASAPAAPQATFVWATGAVTNLTAGWSTSPPTVQATATNNVYNSIVTFHDPTAPFTNSTAIGTTPIEATSFTGLVTFNNGDFSVNGSTITTIDGGNITANTIAVNSASSIISTSPFPALGTIAIPSRSFSIISSNNISPSSSEFAPQDRERTNLFRPGPWADLDQGRIYFNGSDSSAVYFLENIVPGDRVRIARTATNYGDYYIQRVTSRTTNNSILYLGGLAVSTGVGAHDGNQNSFGNDTQPLTFTRVPKVEAVGWEVESDGDALFNNVSVGTFNGNHVSFEGGNYWLADLVPRSLDYTVVTQTNQFIGTRNTGTGNVGIGTDPMSSNQQGSGNVAIGQSTLSGNINGNDNVGIGSYTAFGNASDQIAIGRNAGIATSNGSTICIGADTDATAAFAIQIGSSSAPTVQIGNGTVTSVSDSRDKRDIEDLTLGLAFVDSLETKRFRYNNRDRYKEREGYTERDNSSDDKKDENFTTGLIAQDVEHRLAEFGQAGQYQHLLHVDHRGDYSVVYTQFIPMLMKSVQELSAKNDSLKARIEALEGN